MAYALSISANVSWVPEGAGPQTVPSAQTLNYQIGFPPSAGHAAVQITESTIGSLTAAQVNTACTTAGSLLASYFGTTSLATLQAFSTGAGG